ncbi:MAG: anion permease, partial [Leptospiraceae bacterium]|nr:anion permease [Leptospiraceae bacterium]
MASSFWNNQRKPIVILAGPLLGSVPILLGLDAQQPAIERTAAVAICMGVWWIGEAVPLAVTALLPLVLFPLLGISSGKTIASAYINSTIFLFLGGFLLALAMERWDLHRRIALRIITLFGDRPPLLLLGFMLAAAVLSMWISNTATAVMLLPMVLAIITRLEYNGESGHVHVTRSPDARIPTDRSSNVEVGRLGRVLLIGTAYACSIGGVGTLIGTPPNLILQRTYQITFPDATAIGFADWMIFGIPLAFIALLIAWLLLLLMFRIRFQKSDYLHNDTLRAEYRALGAIRYEEIIVIIVFTFTALLWIFRESISIDFGAEAQFIIPGWSGLLKNGDYLDDGTIAVAMSIVLFIIPAGREARSGNQAHRILDADIFRKVPWGIVLLFGGGFALAEGFQSSGLAEYLTRYLGELNTWPVLLMILAITTMMIFLTEFTSNTASTQMMLPVLAQ